jgi:hypothetical protein
MPITGGASVPPEGKRAGCGPKPKLLPGIRVRGRCTCCCFGRRRVVVATDSRRVEPCLSCEKHRILLSSCPLSVGFVVKKRATAERLGGVEGDGQRVRVQGHDALRTNLASFMVAEGRRIERGRSFFVSVIPTTRSHKHVGRTSSHFDVPSKRFFTLSPSYVFGEPHNQGQWMMKSTDTVPIQQ